MQGSPIDVLKTKIQYNSKTQQGGIFNFCHSSIIYHFLDCRVEGEVFLPHAGTQSKVMSYVIRR